MKNALISMATGEAHRAVQKETLPLLIAYADRIGAELLLEQKPEEGLRIPHYQKLSLVAAALEKFERICWVDADILVSPNAPDIFEEVPAHSIGIFNEAPWVDRQPAMSEWEHLTGFQWPDRTKYFNSGVMVASREHRKVFVRGAGPEINHFGDQTYLNAKILESGSSVFELSHRWNRMSCTWLRGQDPYDSHFIHFAGMQPPQGLPLFIRERLAEWKEHSFSGGSQIFIVAHGGMGNQVATIPVVEEIIRLHPRAKVGIRSAYPEAFDHLREEYPHLEVLRIKREDGETDEQASEKEIAALNQFQFAKVISTKMDDCAAGIDMTEMNSTDYHSLAALGRQLPNKQIWIYRTKKQNLPNNTVAIHAGKNGWPGKNVPIQLYQEILSGLKRLGFQIALIGRRDFREHGPGYGAHELEGADFNFLDADFETTCGVIASSALLVSNDSMPIHAAGAFNNWIACITISKHPDLIFPHRQGSPNHKTIALCNGNQKNIWDLYPRKAFYFPGEEIPSASLLMPGMEWPSAPECISKIVRALNNG